MKLSKFKEFGILILSGKMGGSVVISGNAVWVKNILLTRSMSAEVSYLAITLTGNC